MALLLVMPCPRCGQECTIQPDFNFVQLAQCDKCCSIFQFSFAVRTIDKSNAPGVGGEIRTGPWKVLVAPTIEEVHKNGDIFFRYGPEPETGKERPGKEKPEPEKE
jgi:hypothetical protein